MFLTTMLFGLLSFATSTTIQTNICGLPSSPIITIPATSLTTSTESLLVQGTSTASQTVNILDNNQLEASVTSDSSGNYGANINLQSGLNTIVAQAENNCSQVANSSSVSATYNPPIPPPTNPPSTPATTTSTSTIPTVTSIATTSSSTPPSNTAQTNSEGLSMVVFNPSISGSSSSKATPIDPSAPPLIISKSSILLSGNTGIQANVTVYNNKKIIANLESDSNGYFQVLVALNIGTNNFEFIAAAAHNINESQSFSIVRAVPVQISTKATIAKKNTHYLEFGILAIIILGLIAWWELRKRRVKPIV